MEDSTGNTVTDTRSDTETTSDPAYGYDPYGETPVFVRRNIWSLEEEDPFDPITLAYANAVKALQARPVSDPTSWEYQSAIHGTYLNPPQGVDWNQCQHGSWFFLPWHRMYLFYFEAIIRAEVLAQGGPAEWALPYWNYDEPGHAALPPAFREPLLPDGTQNPLYVQQRAAGINAGAQLPAPATTAAAALAMTEYTPPPPPAFGGGQAPPTHFFGDYGELEMTPHNIVHSLIGGLMGDPNTAATDPVFWLHHANIDRLWNQWISSGGGRDDPTDPTWATQSFSFPDSATSFESKVCGDVESIEDLAYTYDDSIVQPAQPAQPQQAARFAVAGDGAPAERRAAPEPELVGAADNALNLVGSPERVRVGIDGRAARPLLQQRRVEGEEERVYLHLEDIEGEKNPELGYQVYVDSRDDADPEADDSSHQPIYVGTVSFFGIEHLSANRDDAEHTHGFRRTFDITGAAKQLKERGDWDDGQVNVFFRPLGLDAPDGAAPQGLLADAAEPVQPAPVPPIRVGRVSVSFG